MEAEGLQVETVWAEEGQAYKTSPIAQPELNSRKKRTRNKTA